MRKLGGDVKGGWDKAGEICYVFGSAGCVSAMSPIPSLPAILAEEEKAMTAFHVMSGATDSYTRPVVNKISVADVFDALRQGFYDFREKPSHYVFLCLMYPIAGIFLAVATSSATVELL